MLALLSRNLLATSTRVSLRPSLTNRLAFQVQCWSATGKASTLAGQNCRRSFSTGRWLGVAGVVGLGVAASAYSSPTYCQPGPLSSPPPSPSATASQSNTQSKNISNQSNSIPPPPTSAVNLYQLSFGTVAGVCAGVFIKKGAKAIAFVVGGVFVLLQYFNSLTLIRIDWQRAGTKFENLFYSTDENGVKRPPTVVSLWHWLVDFLVADFQPRASFLAGLALGLRVG